MAPFLRISRRGRRGVTIIEAVLWLAIVAVVVGGIMLGFATLTNNQREVQTRQLMQTVLASVRQLYAGSIDYTGLSAAVLVNAGDIPAQFVRGTAIETPDGNAVTLGGWDGGWAVALADLRNEVCVAVLQDFVNNDQLTGVDVEAAAPATINDAATANTITEVANIGAVSTACTATNDSVTLEFR